MKKYVKVGASSHSFILKPTGRNEFSPYRYQAKFCENYILEKGLCTVFLGRCHGVARCEFYKEGKVILQNNIEIDKNSGSKEFQRKQEESKQSFEKRIENWSKKRREQNNQQKREHQCFASSQVNEHFKFPFGTVVCHSIYGEGRISDFVDGAIIVTFEKKGKIAFVPDVFDKGILKRKQKTREKRNKKRCSGTKIDCHDKKGTYATNQDTNELKCEKNQALTCTYTGFQESCCYFTEGICSISKGKCKQLEKCLFYKAKR